MQSFQFSFVIYCNFYVTPNRTIVPVYSISHSHILDAALFNSNLFYTSFVIVSFFSIVASTELNLFFYFETPLISFSFQFSIYFIMSFLFSYNLQRLVDWHTVVIYIGISLCVFFRLTYLRK